MGLPYDEAVLIFFVVLFRIYDTIIKRNKIDGFDFMEVFFLIGNIVKVIVDRPMGSYHPNHKDIFYSINYGYIEGIIAPDGEEQDAYILGIDKPVKEFVGKIIAIIHREDDVEEPTV